MDDLYTLENKYKYHARGLNFTNMQFCCNYVKRYDITSLYCYFYSTYFQFSSIMSVCIQDSVTNSMI